MSILNQQKANSEEKVGEGVYKQEAARVEEDRGGETRFSRIKSRAINFLINNWNQVANIFCQETGNLSPSTESLPFFSNVSLEKKYGVIDFIGLAHDRTVIVIRFIPPGNNGEIDVNKSIIIRNRLVDLLRIFPPTAIKVYKANVFENENKGQSSLIFIEE